MVGAELVGAAGVQPAVGGLPLDRMLEPRERRHGLRQDAEAAVEQVAPELLHVLVLAAAPLPVLGELADCGLGAILGCLGHPHPLPTGPGSVPGMPDRGGSFKAAGGRGPPPPSVLPK